MLASNSRGTREYQVIRKLFLINQVSCAAVPCLKTVFQFFYFEHFTHNFSPKNNSQNHQVACLASENFWNIFGTFSYKIIY